MGNESTSTTNKGGGIQVTAYTQIISGIEAKIGDITKAGQVVGNFNNCSAILQ